MEYLSTRGGIAPQPFTATLLDGLAGDGGLIVPSRLPRLDAALLRQWRALPYADLAFEIMHRFAPDIPSDTLRLITRDAYTAENFSDAAIAPLKPLEDGLFLLGLSQGPTLAFKDMAMQLLGRLFEWVLEREGRSLNVLGATSGDTGSAAEHALRARRAIRVFMLSPLGKMSPFQAAQMYTLDDANIHNIAVRGVFDDCQDMVKALNADAHFKARHALGAVNSINWARVAAQVVYYVHAWLRATTGEEQEIDVSVPTGNFGNIYAAYVARAMGVPLGRLVLATNENDVLDVFFRTGIYRVRAAAQVRRTSSPSMDISKASNFERFIFDAARHDARQVRALWHRLAEEGSFDLSGTELWHTVQHSGFVSGASTHAERLHTIREVHRRHGLLIDPHTADGLKVGREHRRPGVALVCLETASPAKFAETIREALGFDPPRPAALAGLEERPQRHATIDPDPQALRAYIARHATA